MSEAAAKRIAWATGFGLKEKFAGKAPESYVEVLEVIDGLDKKGGKPGKAASWDKKGT